jgi:hypothetical protein
VKINSNRISFIVMGWFGVLQGRTGAKKPPAATGFIKATETLREKPNNTLKKPLYQLKMYLKSLADLNLSEKI